MRKHVPPLVWLNLVCLDAPIVAVLWLWLFARTFHLPVHPGNAIALFLTAWLIYLADRLADALSTNPGLPHSLRQDFCLRHREVWMSALVLIGGFDLYVIWRSVAPGGVLAGALVGLLALIYLALNHPNGRVWRRLPAKEIAIGLLFTAGTLVALLPALNRFDGTFIAGGLAFACLCWVNCTSIARWEHNLDRAQRKTSIATCHPHFVRHTAKIGAGLALLSLTAASLDRSSMLLFGCVAASALLLALLDRLGGELDGDQRTAMADLVLLTPMIPLLALAS